MCMLLAVIAVQLLTVLYKEGDDYHTYTDKDAYLLHSRLVVSIQGLVVSLVHPQDHKLL